jgi:hypothetical protein
MDTNTTTNQWKQKCNHSLWKTYLHIFSPDWVGDDGKGCNNVPHTQGNLLKMLCLWITNKCMTGQQAADAE